MKQSHEPSFISRYNEVCEYNYRFGSRSGSSGTGHFTQVVWKESVKLGIGFATAKRHGMTCYYTVARYRVAGNMMGQFKQNVFKGIM